jgi:hypothetical protein
MKPLKQLRIKVFQPGNTSCKQHRLHVPKGMIVKPGGEFDVLGRIADDLERTFPTEEFEMIEVGRGAYNFVHKGKRPIDPANILVGGLRLGEVATVQVGAELVEVV